MSKYILLACLLASWNFAVVSAADEEPLNAIDGVAMDGFDVVAYFKPGKPKKGLDEYSHEYKGQTWKFSSPGNLQAFQANPEDYEPQFNGWCAYAVSEGYAAEVDFIDGWSILDGKLYLNWSASVSKDFIAEQDRRKPDAEAQWPGVRSRIIDGSLEISRHKRFLGAGIKHPQELPE